MLTAHTSTHAYTRTHARARACRLSPDNQPPAWGSGAGGNGGGTSSSTGAALSGKASKHHPSFNAVKASLRMGKSFKGGSSTTGRGKAKAKATAGGSGKKAKLVIREHQTLGPFVSGRRQVPIETMADLHALLAAGTRARHVAGTDLSAQSSRGHTVFTAVVRGTLHVDSDRDVSILNIVDLCGTFQPQASGECGSINQSLSALGLVTIASAKRDKSVREFREAEAARAATNKARAARFQKPEPEPADGGREPPNKHVPYRCVRGRCIGLYLFF